MLLTTKQVLDKYFMLDENGKRTLSIPKLHKLAKAGKIPAKKIEGRWYFPSEQIDEWAGGKVS